MDSKFDKLYNMFMEEVKSSKKTVIKEAVSPNYQQYVNDLEDDANSFHENGIKDVWNAITNIIKANPDKVAALDDMICNFCKTNNDSYGMYQDVIEGNEGYADDANVFYGLKEPQTFKNLGFVLDPNDERVLKQYTVLVSDGDSYWSYGGMGDVQDDQCKEMLRAWGLNNTADQIEMMVDEDDSDWQDIPYKDDTIPVESVKKPVSKRRVIKESKLVSKRHIIKEEYSICDAMKKYFDKYNKEYFDNLENKNEIDNINEQKRTAYWGAISDVLKQNDPEKVKAFLNNIKELGDVEWKIITQQSGLDITPEQIDIFEDFSAFNEMAEKWYNPYWGDGWMEEDVCEALEKAGYGEYIDKITLIESKKVNRSRKVIKESAKRPVRRHLRRSVKK